MNNQTSQKSKRAERPDKGLFMTMMGVFFLLFANAPAYWAFYNYGEYRQTADFGRELRKNETDATPRARQERGERISILSSRAESATLIPLSNSKISPKFLTVSHVSASCQAEN